MISRSSWACAQVSGEAEPAGWPSTKPIDAVVGSLPYGDAGRSGSSHTCSGTSPSPEAEPSMNGELRRRGGVVAGQQVATRPARRRAPATGARCRRRWSATGCPIGVQVDWLGW